MQISFPNLIGKIITYLEDFIFLVSVDRACETAVTDSIDNNVSVWLGTWFHKQLRTYNKYSQVK